MPMLSGYGRELFATFAPSSAKARAAEARSGAALLSGALLARHKPGVVVELTFPGRAALAGALRAVKHADAVVAVAVPWEQRSQSPQAPHNIIRDILAAADAAHHDRPIITVARAQPLAAGQSIDRLSEGLYRDVEAGFTAIGFSPAALAGDVDALVRVTAPLVEQDLGLELELNATGPVLGADRAGGGTGGGAALILARVDDAGLSLSAVRGADPMDELGGAYLVVDAESSLGGGAAPPSSASAPLRVVVDRRLAKVLERAGDDDERREAAAWLEVDAGIAAAGGQGTSKVLLEALAASLR